MAKLIKKGSNEVQDTSREVELTQISEARRAPIIDRDTFEARAAAQQIRERAQAQADEIVAKAQAEAQAVREAAQQEAAQLRETAQKEGYDEGRQAGVSELTEMVAQISTRAQSVEDQLVPQLTELAIGIARKVLGRELQFHPDAVVQLVKQALGDKARQRKEIFLRVHPEDLAVIREHKAELLEMLSRTKEIGIREDPQVQRYGVVIETDAGTIDAQLDTQLAVFERVLLNVG